MRTARQIIGYDALMQLHIPSLILGLGWGVLLGHYLWYRREKS